MQKISGNKNKTRQGLSTEIIVAIIAGVFALGAALTTAGPSWISAIGNNPLSATSTPTWPPLPIMNDPLLPTEASSPLRLSNIQIDGDDIFFDSMTTAAEASNLREDEKIVVTTNEIGFYITVTSTAPIEWIKFDNQILFRIDSIKELPQGNRQNILHTGLPPGTGGPGYYSEFSLRVKGPIQENDILISPPTKDADFFTLQPGETLPLNISSAWSIPAGIYSISIGIRYEYMGNSRMIWSNDTYEIMSPANPLIWVYGQNGWESSVP